MGVKCLLLVFAGLVLMNSAGLIVKDYKPDPAEASEEAQLSAAKPAIGPPGIIADVVTSALLFYLEKTITRQALVDLQ